MPLNCDPAALAKAAACYCYSDKKVVEAVIVYLLAQMAGDTSTPAALAKKAACYCYSDKNTFESVVTMLLCANANK